MKRKFPIVLLALVSLVFTAFVFLNTYEVVFNHDITGGVSIQKIAAQDVVNAIVKGFSAKQADTGVNYSNLGRLQYFEIPDLHMRVSMEEARRINGKWYRRPSLAEYVGLNKGEKDVTVDYLIYTSRSWRTVPDPAQIEKGMQVKVFYQGGNLTFKVAEKKILPLTSSLIVGKSEDRQMLLVVEDAPHGTYAGFSLVGEN
jgi:hypothetical protein